MNGHGGDDTTFPDVETFESSNRRYTLHSLYTALDHQLQDGLMAQHQFDRMRYVVRKLFDLKLQIHTIEADIVGHTVELMLDLYSEGILTRSSMCVLKDPTYARL